jgi:hypothetical protein
MKLRKWLENWDLTKLKINLKVLEMEWEPQEKDREAAWELYIELLTRITTQPLPEKHGDEKTALDSVYNLFPMTREILKRKGRECEQFTKLAVVVLNQIVRPFTAKWHRKSLAGHLKGAKGKVEFRADLKLLQRDLKNYSRLLAEIAQIEDMTELAKGSAL